MYAVDKGAQKINGQIVETFHREVRDRATLMDVEAGTTGYKGGCCRASGCRTFLSLMCQSGDFFFGPIPDDEGRIVGIDIACCGDDGLNAVLRALDFARDVINDQRRHVKD